MSESCVDLVPRSVAFVVLVSETLVAQDIAQTIIDFVPSAEVTVASSLSDARAALERMARVGVAFICGDPESVVTSGIAEAVSNRGGRLVLLGMDAETAGPAAGFDVLMQPFDTEAVVAKLRVG